jgi:hypothetical protein
LRVRTGCNGNGSCGLCRVQILSGKVSPPTSEEMLTLGLPLVQAGLRLACQVVPLGDVDIEVVNPAPRSAWHPISSRGSLQPGASDRQPPQPVRGEFPESPSTWEPRIFA